MKPFSDSLLEPQSRCAGFLARCCAFLLDAAIRAAVLGAIVMILVLAGVSGGPFIGGAVIFLALFILNGLYPILFELSAWAATPGKRALGLKVVLDSGLPVTAAASLIRNLLRIVDCLPLFYGVGLVSLLFRQDCKRIGDIAAGTRVVYDRGPAQPSRLPAGAPIRPAIALSPCAEGAVIDFALRAARLTPERAQELAALARPLWGDRGDEQSGAANADAVQRLIGAAHWILDARTSGAHAGGGGREPLPAARPRTAYEACDLGMRLCRDWAGSIYGSYLAVAVPVAMLALATSRWADWLPGLMIWWLKPWLDRTILFALSRAQFDAPTRPLDVWRAQRQVWWSQIPQTLLLQRLSPWRSLTQPVYQLEGIRGAERRLRLSQIRGGGGLHAALVTQVFSIVELALLVGGLALMTGFAPGWDRLSFAPADLAAIGSWVDRSTSVAYALIVCMLEPMYAAAGFGLYLNRRAELEGWDIEQRFRGAFAH